MGILGGLTHGASCCRFEGTSELNLVKLMLDSFHRRHLKIDFGREFVLNYWKGIGLQQLSTFFRHSCRIG